MIRMIFIRSRLNVKKAYYLTFECVYFNLKIKLFIRKLSKCLLIEYFYHCVGSISMLGGVDISHNYCSYKIK